MASCYAYIDQKWHGRLTNSRCQCSTCVRSETYESPTADVHAPCVRSKTHQSLVTVLNIMVANTRHSLWILAFPIGWSHCEWEFLLSVRVRLRTWGLLVNKGWIPLFDLIQTIPSVPDHWSIQLLCESHSFPVGPKRRPFELYIHFSADSRGTLDGHCHGHGHGRCHGTTGCWLADSQKKITMSGHSQKKNTGSAKRKVVEDKPATPKLAKTTTTTLSAPVVLEAGNPYARYANFP